MAIGADDRVLVVGNGLTSADVIASLELRGIGANHRNIPSRPAFARSRPCEAGAVRRLRRSSVENGSLLVAACSRRHTGGGRRGAQLARRHRSGKGARTGLVAGTAARGAPPCRPAFKALLGCSPVPRCAAGGGCQRRGDRNRPARSACRLGCRPCGDGWCGQLQTPPQSIGAKHRTAI